ncbi:hypothetical protein EUX98_g2584 [Antrodiella citrinella]|uniref:GPI transamidase component PIG-T n=1 Tax=Antrodiella citrinella TaxID=2447956 RepID=A0A4S4MZZ5_9APHY|nr:hypothetical protein EUX98_g2584 [Antrodiella citrinella]
MLLGGYLKFGLILSLGTPFTLGRIFNEEFDETLALRPLLDGRLLSAFSFKTLLRGATPRDPGSLGVEDETQHYTLFPLALGQILREYAVTEMHMTLNAGKWDYDRWGFPEETGVGTGAELWAYMGNSTVISGAHAHETLLAAKPLDISMQWQEEFKFMHPLMPPSPPLTPISVQRTLKGSIQSQGRLSVVITNHLPITLQTSYLETMPWLLQFFLHSLQTFHNGVSRDDLVSIVSYTPPVPHLRPTLFQALLTLPPKGTLHLTMDVMKPFLRYTEHPPDAERGWDLPPAVFVPLISGSAEATNDTHRGNVAGLYSRNQSRRMYTSVLLVDLATPDFSMPYNVIIMSCTLIALIFGSVFNLLTRKFVVIRVNQDTKDAVAASDESK